MSNESTSERSVKDGWALLRAGKHDATLSGVLTLRTDVHAAAGQVRLALGGNGEVRLLLPLSDRESVRGIIGAPALGVAISTFSLNGQKAHFLDLLCRVHDLEPVFAEVAAELLSRITKGASCADAARTTLRDFRTLLLVSGAKIICKSEISGLVGELLVLNRLLDRTPKAWSSWRGPAGDRHDFRCGNTSLEIKVSTHKGGTAVINGLYQLEPPSNGTLHLLNLILEPVVGGLLTIASLANSAIAKSADSQKLVDLIGMVGCHDINAEEWNAYAFRLEGEKLYEVSDKFPRITPSTLLTGLPPQGVSDVSYSLDLSVAHEFARGSDHYIQLEEALTKCD